MKPVIIGAGMAGLTAALTLAPMPVVVVSPRRLGVECSSAWAQGGIAAAVGDDDSPGLHAEDTLKAGAGLCDPAVVRAVTEDGPRVIDFLSKAGAPFDRDGQGKLRLGLEAAHGRRRIVHAADSTGAAALQALMDAARATASIEILEEAFAREVVTENGAVVGVVVEYQGMVFVLPTRQAVLATGSAGALWRHTSVPLGSWGAGLLLAARAGAVLGDMEFMQFHPTGMDVGRDPMPLASEALRGEGCTLIDDTGERFIEELQLRDIVARAIWQRQAEGHKVFLDARQALGAKFASRFPTIYASCLAAGIDPATTPIPVAPTAHYHMGGVVTDLRGRTNVEGLWACGEVACTGLHGANRLASNSLLEAASFGRWVGEDIAGSAEIRRVIPDNFLFAQRKKMDPESDVVFAANNKSDSGSPLRGVRNDGKQRVRDLMSQHVGVMRCAEGLQEAVRELAALAPHSDKALVALMIAASAQKREESRGSHARTDFPATDASWQRHVQITLDDVQPLLDIHKVTGA